MIKEPLFIYLLNTGVKKISVNINKNDNSNKIISTLFVFFFNLCYFLSF